MDLFVEKLNEYGLEARNTQKNRQTLETVQQFLDKKIMPDMQLKQLVFENVFILVRDVAKFLKKVGIQYDDIQLAEIILDRVQLDFEAGDERFYFYSYNASKGNYDKDIIQHIKNNTEYFKKQEPEWYIRKIFNEDEAITELVERLKKDARELTSEVEKSEIMKTLYDELLVTIKKMG